MTNISRCFLWTSSTSWTAGPLASVWSWTTRTSRIVLVDDVEPTKMLVCHKIDGFTGLHCWFIWWWFKPNYICLITFLAESLAEVFSWLGFRVLMCKDLTRDQMDQALKCFASLSDLSKLQQLSVQEWSGNRFTDLQEAPKHGDAFVCSVLSHGQGSAVIGIDGNYLSIKDITGTFKATDQSTHTGKPKVFLIEASSGNGVDCSSYPLDTDVLVARSSVVGQLSYRNTISGSWFTQSVCRQLREGCLR